MIVISFTTYASSDANGNYNSQTVNNPTTSFFLHLFVMLAGTNRYSPVVDGSTISSLKREVYVPTKCHSDGFDGWNMAKVPR